MKEKQKLKTLKDIDGQKVKRVLIVIELENGKSVIACPTAIGEINKLVTLNDLQRRMSNNDGSDDMKFSSPIIFDLDIRSAAREWIKQIEQWDYCKASAYKLDGMEIQSMRSTEVATLINWIKHFFNLED